MPQTGTEQRRRVLAFIQQFVGEKGNSPRQEEIAGCYGVTAPTGHKYLKAFQSEGFLCFGGTPTRNCRPDTTQTSLWG